jgi:hypothetical protein
MDLTAYSPAIQNLARLGAPDRKALWLDYNKLGVTQADAPDLAAILENIQVFEQMESDDPRLWLLFHTCRALAQVQGAAAVPTFLSLIGRVEAESDERIDQDLPRVFAHIGSPAFSELDKYLRNRKHPERARQTAADGLAEIAKDEPLHRDEAIKVLSEILHGYTKNSAHFNSILIRQLQKLKSVEAAPLVKEVFDSGRIDLDVVNDWEDYQVAVGLLEKRLTPRQTNRTGFDLHAPGYLDGMILAQAEKAARQRAAETARKEKHKRKSAKANRKKNRGKKK